MTSLLSPSGKETVKTVKTTLEIEIQRTETVSQITCTQCARTGDLRKVEFTPPASIGGSVASCRVPDGWWVQGASYFNFKGTCPDCFEKPFAGVVRSNDGSRARSANSKEAASSSMREEPLSKAAVDSDLDRPGDSAWHAMLSTPGGASAVAKALAIHLRQTAVSIPGTSLPRVIETLKAASARLEEFRPKDAAEVDLRRSASDRSPHLSRLHRSSKRPLPPPARIRRTLPWQDLFDASSAPASTMEECSLRARRSSRMSRSGVHT